MKSFVVGLFIGAINCASLRHMNYNRWVELPNCNPKAPDWGLQIPLEFGKANASVATCKDGPLSPTAVETANMALVNSRKTAIAPPIFSPR